MAFLLQDIIFKLFGSFEKREDSYKDEAGRGLNERVNRTLGQDFDENTTPFLNELIDRTLVPADVLARFIPYLEEMMGVGQPFTDEIAIRRKLLRFITRITAIKGTARSFDVLFKLLGFTSVTLIEHAATFGFNSAVTWDDPVRRLNSGCPSCTDYSLELTGTMPLTAELRDTIGVVVKFCQPINARLRAILYNGDPVETEALWVLIQQADLFYDNSLSPADVMFMDAKGDLYIEGPNEDRYTVDKQGDLIYQ